MAHCDRHLAVQDAFGGLQGMNAHRRGDSGRAWTGAQLFVPMAKPLLLPFAGF